jgi:Methyltransferase domain
MTTMENQRQLLMHRARTQEIGIVFAHTPESAFAKGLELGAGDCYQSRYLKRYVADLTATDFDASLLDRSDVQISYSRCDAEEVDKVFSGQRFNLVFTSNMLPHTPNPQYVLTGIRKITDDDAVLVIVVPSPLWKIAKLVLFYPLLFIALPQRVWKYTCRYLAGHGRGTASANAGVKLTNNPKVPRHVSRWRKRLLPVPIGVYTGNMAEVVGSRRGRWISELQQAGWHVVRVFRGPFIVGDMNVWWNDLFARLGFSTENIFVARKKDCCSPYESFFTDADSNSRTSARAGGHARTA